MAPLVTLKGVGCEALPFERGSEIGSLRFDKMALANKPFFLYGFMNAIIHAFHQEKKHATQRQ